MKDKTPYYLYSMKVLQDTLDECVRHSQPHNYKVLYAMKANCNEPILKIIKEKGFGLDCVSGNEIKKGLAMGFKPKDIAFAGVGKTDEEIVTAITNEIGLFVVESIHELKVLEEISASKGRAVSVALRINPEVHAYTHSYITTGLEENKFGISTDELDECIKLIENSEILTLKGIHFHIGSQIIRMDVFTNLCHKINQINVFFATKGFDLQCIDVGGGLGVDYEDQHKMPDFKSYFQTFAKYLNLKDGQKVQFELGRSLVANCGQLLSKILYVKNRSTKKFLIIDAGMTELMRPALYKAYHKIEKVPSNNQCDNKELELYDVVGPICESSDTFGSDVYLPKCQRGDVLAIQSVGAYGQVLSSNYNLRDRAEEVYIV